jgi:hypothetical protein
VGSEAGAEALSDAALRLEDGIQCGALSVLCADRLREPSSGSESDAGIAALRPDGETGDEFLCDLPVRLVEETPREPRLEVEPAVGVPVGGSDADETGDRTLLALGAGCPEEATNGTGVNSSVGAVDGVVK